MPTCTARRARAVPLRPTAVSYVRAGAPDPNKPVLVLDRLDLDFVVSLDSASAPGWCPRVVMDPRSAEFASAPLTTSRYSAILIASDINCGGCDLNEFDSTPDSDAIAARKADIAAFFNAAAASTRTQAPLTATEIPAPAPTTTIRSCRCPWR